MTTEQITVSLVFAAIFIPIIAYVVRDNVNRFREWSRFNDGQPSMRFRERLALVLFVLPLILLLVGSALGITTDDPRVIVKAAMYLGAGLGGSAWVLITVLKWLVTGRA